MQLDTDSKSSSLTSIENLLKLTPFFTAVILAISITYDYAYLKALGLTFADIPSSITEHIRSALLWSPMFLLLFMLAFLVILIDEIPNPKEKPSKENAFLKKNQNKIYAFFSIIFILLFGLFIMFTGEVQFIYIFYSVTWMLLIVGIFLVSNPKFTGNRLIIFASFITPVILFIFAFFGNIDGRSLYKSEIALWEYTVKSEDKQVVIHFKGQRRFTDFTIGVVDYGKVQIISNNNIISIKSRGFKFEQLGK